MQKVIQKLGRPNLYDYLKVLAIVTMICDHAGYFLFPNNFELRMIGRWAFPIFLFLVGLNGNYRHSRSLFIAAVLVQLPDSYLQHKQIVWGTLLSILASIWLVRWSLLARSKVKLESRTKYILTCCLIAILGICQYRYGSSIELVFDYGLMSWIFAFIGYLFAAFPKMRMINILLLIGAFVGHYIYQQATFQFTGSNALLVAGEFIVSILLLIRVSRDNLSLQTHTGRDSIILLFSRYAVRIYVLHVLLFGYIAVSPLI